MLFLYENRKQKSIINFPWNPMFEVYMYKKHQISLLVRHNTTQDRRLGIAGLWHQYSNAYIVVSQFLYPQLFHIFVLTVFLLCTQKTTKEKRKCNPPIFPVYMYCRCCSPTIPSLLSCAVICTH